MTQLVIMGEVMIELAPLPDGLYQRGVAGDTYNTACTAQGLGVATLYVTALGASVAAQGIRQHAKQRSLQILEPQWQSTRTPGLYMISNDDQGERYFEYWRGESAAKELFTNAPLFSNVLEQIPARSWLYVSGITLALMSTTVRTIFIDFCQRHKASDGVICFDPNYRPALWADESEAALVIHQMLRVTDIYLPGAVEERDLFNHHDFAQTYQQLAADSMQEVVMKDGANLCEIAIAGATHRVQIEPASEVLDATGAGDTFNGAYLASRLLGNSVLESVNIASQQAKAVLSVRGGILPLSLLQPISARNHYE